MPCIDLTTAKQLLQIPEADQSKDTLIDTMIPIIDAAIRTYTKQDFENADGTDSFPADLQLIAIQLLGRVINPTHWQGIQSESIDITSVALMTDLPAWCLKILNGYKRIKFL